MRVLLILVALASPAVAQELTPVSLHAALAGRPTGPAATQLAERIRKWLGKDLAAGTAARVEGLDAAWAIEAPGAKQVEAVSVEGNYKLSLQPVGDTGVFANAASLSDGTAMRWTFEVDGQSRGGGKLEAYAVHPDSLARGGVPRGVVTQQKPWKSTRVFAGTERDWWIYVPAQIKAGTPAALMVFQDGGGYVKYVPTVFDNLIAKGDMPPTVGVFINPGAFADGRKNRSFEYDTLSDQYVRFLLEEILPEVGKTVKLRNDAASRAIIGASSGGICAFTAAWQRPDQFGKVLSMIGSFTNIAAGKTMQEGGHNYPALIRKIPRKAIRVLLQDGKNDLDNAHGNWPLGNEQMAKALAFAGYDSRIIWGNGFHSQNHGRAILPDALRWLWRDHTGVSAR